MAKVIPFKSKQHSNDLSLFRNLRLTIWKSLLLNIDAQARMLGVPSSVLQADVEERIAQIEERLTNSSPASIEEMELMRDTGYR